jgi:hypothetical protein
METTIPIQETNDSINVSTIVRRVGLAASAATLLLTGCASHDASSAPEPAKPTATTTSANAHEAIPTCDVSTNGGDFTVRAHYPKSNSAKAPMITLTSDKQFGLGNSTDFDMRGDWVTVFKHQPQSNNQAIRKDGEFEMSLFNGDADLNVHAGRLLLQGHGDAVVSCEAAD